MRQDPNASFDLDELEAEFFGTLDPPPLRRPADPLPEPLPEPLIELNAPPEPDLPPEVAFSSMAIDRPAPEPNADVVIQVVPRWVWPTLALLGALSIGSVSFGIGIWAARPALPGVTASTAQPLVPIADTHTEPVQPTEIAPMEVPDAVAPPRAAPSKAAPPKAAPQKAAPSKTTSTASRPARRPSVPTPRPGPVGVADLAPATAPPPKAVSLSALAPGSAL